MTEEGYKKMMEEINYLEIGKTSRNFPANRRSTG